MTYIYIYKYVMVEVQAPSFISWFASFSMFHLWVYYHPKQPFLQALRRFVGAGG